MTDALRGRVRKESSIWERMFPSMLMLLLYIDWEREQSVAMKEMGYKANKDPLVGLQEWHPNGGGGRTRSSIPPLAT